MRVAGRPAALVAITLALVVMLIVPASAGQLIRYRGETSGDPSWNRIRLGVLKRDNGRRFLERFVVFYTLTCEDATTEQWGIGIQWISGAPRLDEDGGFVMDDDFEFEYFYLDGTVRWRRAAGTLLVTQARLTDDHLDSQVCTTGELTWAAERIREGAARSTAGGIPEGTGFMKIRVTDGVAEVVKRIEP